MAALHTGGPPVGFGAPAPMTTPQLGAFGPEFAQTVAQHRASVVRAASAMSAPERELLLTGMGRVLHVLHNVSWERGHLLARITQLEAERDAAFSRILELIGLIQTADVPALLNERRKYEGVPIPG